MWKILYVEDDAAQRDIVSQALEDRSYLVAVAADGAAGVEKARAWQPDLILMDLRMPGLDGYQAIHMLRSDAATANIPIVAISAWASEQSSGRALEAGADAHVTKPIDIWELIATINKYLGGPS